MSGIPLTSNFNDAHNEPISANTKFADMAELLAQPTRKEGVDIWLWKEKRHVYWAGTEYVQRGEGGSAVAGVVVDGGGISTNFTVGLVDGGSAASHTVPGAGSLLS